jgi:hypothetical protein
MGRVNPGVRMGHRWLSDVRQVGLGCVGMGVGLSNHDWGVGERIWTADICQLPGNE